MAIVNTISLAMLLTHIIGAELPLSTSRHSDHFLEAY
jgi:hypothetical protein